MSRRTGRATLLLPNAVVESWPPEKTSFVFEPTVAFSAVTVVMNSRTSSSEELLEPLVEIDSGRMFKVTSGPVYLEVSIPPKRMVPLV